MEEISNEIGIDKTIEARIIQLCCLKKCGRPAIESSSYCAKHKKLRQGKEYNMTKPCFGERCKGCKEFWSCDCHFPKDCWGEL